MEWNGKWNGMEQKFRLDYERCQNGMEDFKNGMEDNLPYFHITSILDFVHCFYKKRICGCLVVINIIVTEVFNFNIKVYYLLTNRGTLVE